MSGRGDEAEVGVGEELASKACRGELPSFNTKTNMIKFERSNMYVSL